MFAVAANYEEFSGVFGSESGKTPVVQENQQAFGVFPSLKNRYSVATISKANEVVI